MAVPGVSRTRYPAPTIVITRIFDDVTLDSSDYFGHSVALDGDTLVVGAHGNNSGGEVYIFTRSSSTWSLQDEISNTDHSDNTGFESDTLNSNDSFGYSVALDGNTLAVGADGDDGSDCRDCGAVYIFTRSSGSWSLQKEISSTTDMSILDGGDSLGRAVAISGSHSAGGVYVFSKINQEWIWSQGLFNLGISYGIKSSRPNRKLESC